MLVFYSHLGGEKLCWNRYHVTGDTRPTSRNSTAVAVALQSLLTVDSALCSYTRSECVSPSHGLRAVVTG